MRQSALVIFFTVCMLVTSILFVQCSGGKSGGKGSYIIPVLKTTCLVSRATGCGSQAQGKTMYVGINPGSNFISCANLLDSLTSALEFKSSFEAWTSVNLTSDGSKATSQASVWYSDPATQTLSVSVINAISCAFIDLNANGRLDAGEPVAEQTLSMGVDTEYLESWSTR